MTLNDEQERDRKAPANHARPTRAGVDEAVLATMAEAAGSARLGADTRPVLGSQRADQPTAAADSPGVGDPDPRTIRSTWIPGDGPA